MMNTVKYIICAADGMRITRHVRLLASIMIVMKTTIAALDEPVIRGNATEVPQLDLIVWKNGSLESEYGSEYYTEDALTTTLEISGVLFTSIDPYTETHTIPRSN